MESFLNKVKSEDYVKDGKELPAQVKNALLEGEQFVPEGENELEGAIED